MSEQNKQASTPSRAGMFARLAAAGVVALSFGLPWQAAQAADGGEVTQVSCEPNDLNCTANDAQGSISVTAQDISSCTVGEWVDVPVTIQATTSGNNERLDIGAWFDSQAPGQCQNVMTTATNDVADRFRNIDGDTCGDMSGAGTASQTFTVKVQCNPDANGKITFPTLAYWSNKKDANTCNPYPATKSKCTKGTTTVNVAAIKGKITVKKIATDAPAGTLFPFTVTAGAGGAAEPDSFSLEDGDTRTVTATATAEGVRYTIAESSFPSGWQYKSASCSNTATGAAVPVDYVAGGITVSLSHAINDISCEFVNIKTPVSGTVTVIKQLTPGDDGLFNYTLTGQAEVQNSAGSGQKQQGSFYAGATVQFGETAAVGTNLDHYNRTFNCVQGTTPVLLTVVEPAKTMEFKMPDSAGGGVVCTINNQRKSHWVKVNKVLNDGAAEKGTFNLSINDSLRASGVGNHTDDSTDFLVAVGTKVTVSEAIASGALSNYASTVFCGEMDSLEPNDTGTSATFNMPDRDVTCTFTNTRKQAKLKVAKAWAEGFNAGDKATVTTTGFTHNANSGESTAGTGTTGAEVTVYAGETGQLTETFSVGNMTDYTQGYACSGGGTVDTEGNVSIGAADKDKTITCTLTNTRKSSAIRIIKTSSAGEGKLVPGGTVTYTVVVSNTGQIGLIDVPVNDPMPAGIESQTWSCIGASGASCNPASGSGGIAGTVNLPAGSSVTYTVTAQVSDSLDAAVTNTATVTPPSGTACANEPPSTTESCSASVTNEPGPRPPAPGAVAPIPTTSPEGLAALALMMVGVAGWAARRQRRGRK